MAKTINLTYEGTAYTLEFTRKTIQTMEKNGFLISEITEKPMSTLPVLFAGAFLAHHRNVKSETIDDIFAALSDKEGFIEKLAEMYSEPIEALMDDFEGNLTWEANW